MHKKVLAALPGHQTKQIGDLSFAYGVIQDKQGFDAMNKVAAANPHNSVHDWNSWAGSLDWDRKVVVYVIRTAPTNLVKLGSLRASRDTMKLGLRFSAIEPSYGEHYPVVLYRFTRGRQDKVAVSIDMGNGNPSLLGTIKLPD